MLSPGKGTSGKYETALSLIRAFPQLEWKLPPRRKPWQPEHRNMCIFDAVAIGVAYFARDAMNNEGTECPPIPFAGLQVT